MNRILFKTIFAALSLITFKAYSSLGYANQFQEEFQSFSPIRWWYDLAGHGKVDIRGQLNLGLFAGASNTSYSNSAAVTRMNFFKKSFSLKVKVTEFSPGSRGWGFWNGSMDPSQSAIAWFIYLESNPEYPLNGFYAVVQKPGSIPQFFPLNPIILEQEHNYKIKWTNEIEFFIDGKSVAKSIETVNTEMAVHIWIDNAVYDLDTFQPLFQKIEKKSRLIVDKLILN